MRALDQLPPRDEKGNVLCVVEAPRGSRVKLKYDPKLGAVLLGRPLPLGLHYPFDWGFVPGTAAADGDPIDAMVLHDAPTYPGVAIPSKLIGVVQVEEKKAGKKRRNDRLIAVAVDAPRFDDLRHAHRLPKRTRDEIEHFFRTVPAFTEKTVKLLGWAGPREAMRLLNEAIQSLSSSRSRRGG
jgi:inorganic pyrophosphatase